MKTNKIIPLSFLAAIVLVAGCSSSSKTAAVPDEDDETTQNTLERVYVETKEAAKAIQDYAHEQRADYVKAMKSELADAKREIDQIETRISRSGKEVKLKAEQRILELRGQISKLEIKLETIEATPESTWSSVKSGFASAWESTKTGLNEARQWVSDQIEPEETP